MSKDPYLILGINRDATQAEIDEAYRLLVDRYRADRFKEGELGAEASRKLDEVYAAYDEVMSRAKTASFIDDGKDCYEEVISLIKKDDINAAQEKLDNITLRSAKWNYLQANIYYKRGWLVESKKQLELAVAAEPENKKYLSDLEKLKKEMNPQQIFGDSNTARPEGRSYSEVTPSQGDMCCDSCATCLCMNTLCNCCWS